MFLPCMIKLSQTVWELWPAQDLGFRGDKYITWKVRIVSLAYDTSSGPYLCLYQISSKYFKLLRSYEVRKNLAKKSFRGDNKKK